MKHLLALLCFLSLTCVVKADDAVPAIVTAGIQALVKDGPSAAIDVWLKDSPIANDTSGKSQLNGGLTTVQELYGKALGFELIEAYKMTPSVTRVYGIITYEKGMLYARFDCYQAASGWIIPELVVNTTAEQVLPESLLTD